MFVHKHSSKQHLKECLQIKNMSLSSKVAALGCLVVMLPVVASFLSTTRPCTQQLSSFHSSPPSFRSPQITRLFSENENREIRFNREIGETTTNLDEIDSTPVDTNAAVTNTVNERLLAELKAAENKERFGARSAMGKKLSMVDGYGRPRKSEEEVQAAIAAARDLNGVNPIVCLTGGAFALVVAGGLWFGTQELGKFFALHPVVTDVYFVIRATQVVRNVAMGLISLASGFFFVTGLGIFGLGVRVAYGVTTGELDPTPIKQNQKAMNEMPNVWDLMMGKKPNRRSRGSDGNDNNPFGI